MKICNECGKPYDSEPENFYFNKSKGKYEMGCKNCARERVRQWRIDNPERAAKNQRQWALTHPEKRRDIVNRYVQTHRELMRARGREQRTRPETQIRIRAYRQSHIPEMRQYLKQWREKNPEAFKAIQQKYKLAHPEGAKFRKATRRAREYGAPGSHTKEDIARQYESQGGLCYWCSAPLSKKYHLDHVIPLARGGSNNPDNLVCACPKCNLRKWSKLPEEFTP